MGFQDVLCKKNLFFPRSSMASVLIAARLMFGCVPEFMWHELHNIPLFNLYDVIWRRHAIMWLSSRRRKKEERTNSNQRCLTIILHKLSETVLRDSKCGRIVTSVCGKLLWFRKEGTLFALYIQVTSKHLIFYLIRLFPEYLEGSWKFE